jgi:hypothetical protein
MPNETIPKPVSYLGRGRRRVSATKTSWSISPDTGEPVHSSEPANSSKTESRVDQRILERLESIDKNTAVIRRIMAFWSGVVFIGGLVIAAWFANH